MKMVNVVVTCEAPRGFHRAGRHWPAGKTPAEVSESALALLQADKMLKVKVLGEVLGPTEAECGALYAGAHDLARDMAKDLKPNAVEAQLLIQGYMDGLAGKPAAKEGNLALLRELADRRSGRSKPAAPPAEAPKPAPVPEVAAAPVAPAPEPVKPPEAPKPAQPPQSKPQPRR